jgi:putative hemolysin
MTPSRREEPNADRLGARESGSGRLEVRLARGADELDAAQALRYRVFYEEMAALPSPEAAAPRRDFDRFDDYCDHLLIIDPARPAEERVVGTYRLLRRSAAERAGGFYSASEFDIAPLIAQPGEILELGRSCVDRAYRTRLAMNMLWGGIAEYALRHGIVVMFGCASLPGTDPAALAGALSYLYRNHLAPPGLRARALPHRYVAMDAHAADPDEATAISALDVRAAVAPLPPLIKGYLRLGGFVGDGAVIDREFNTTDVCVIVKTDTVTEKYLRHYVRGMG